MACPYFRESTRFLERKLGKELCAKLRFASGVPPRRAGRRCAFLSDQKGTKESPGDGSDERLRGAGAHRRRPPGPPATGDVLLGVWLCLPGGPKTRSSVLLASGTQAPTWAEIKNDLRCTDTAYLGRAVAAGPPSHRRTQQEGRYQAVCDRSNSPQILMAKGPKA